MVEGFRYDAGNAEEERDGGEKGDVEEKREKEKSREVGIWRSNPVGRMIGLCWLYMHHSHHSLILFNKKNPLQEIEKPGRLVWNRYISRVRFGCVGRRGLAGWLAGWSCRSLIFN